MLGGEEVGGGRGGKFQRAAVAGMGNFQAVGVEHLAGDFEVGGKSVAGAAIGGVADDGMA